MPVTKLTDLQKGHLLARLCLFCPGLEYAPGKPWDGQDVVHFESTCGCYSKYTTEACTLTVFVASAETDEDKMFYINYVLGQEAYKWAKDNLAWHGCECCDNALCIDVRLFSKEADNAT